jgi:hypothetical protein
MPVTAETIQSKQERIRSVINTRIDLTRNRPENLAFYCGKTRPNPVGFVGEKARKAEHEADFIAKESPRQS